MNMIICTCFNSMCKSPTVVQHLNEIYRWKWTWSKKSNQTWRNMTPTTRESNVFGKKRVISKLGERERGGGREGGVERRMRQHVIRNRICTLFATLRQITWSSPNYIICICHMWVSDLTFDIYVYFAHSITLREIIRDIEFDRVCAHCTGFHRISNHLQYKMQ